jgi:hypothetical protein
MDDTIDLITSTRVLEVAEAGDVLVVDVRSKSSIIDESQVGLLKHCRLANKYSVIFDKTTRDFGPTTPQRVPPHK